MKACKGGYLDGHYKGTPITSVVEVIKKIKACGFDYDKANNNLFDNTVEKLDIALANAQKSLKDSKIDEELNPSTAFSILIEQLKWIANPSDAKSIHIKDIDAIIHSAVNSAFERSFSTTNYFI
ncbi:MAG: hypothetical protein HRT35_27095 [Algicola sp.]|nr:hypothetical protein [Algicola sp.]